MKSNQKHIDRIINEDEILNQNYKQVRKGKKSGQDEDAENLLALEFYRRALVGRQDDTFIEQFRSEHH